MNITIKAVADFNLVKYAGLLIYRGPAVVCDRLFYHNGLDINKGNIHVGFRPRLNGHHTATLLVGWVEG